MSIRVIGAGLGRTGTTSLKIALEMLLNGPCYHMTEVIEHSEHIAQWHAAAKGKIPDWHALFEGYSATVDWPAASFWPELMLAFPSAVIVLSERDIESWWDSARNTIFRILESDQLSPEWRAMFSEVLARRWTTAICDQRAAKAAFNRHNRAVREFVPADRLVVWRAEDGWAPLCKALNCPIPTLPFPRSNTREAWRQQASSREQIAVA